jgi:hypothetical protein
MLTNIHWLYITNIHLSSGWRLTYPSENMTSSVGMMKFPINMEK